MLFASLSENHAVLVDIETKSVVRRYSVGEAHQNGVLFLPLSNSIVVHQSKTNCASFFSANTQQAQLRSFTPESIQSCAATACGSFMFGGGVGGNIYVWNAPTGQLVRSFKGHFRGIACISISSDSSLAATASEDSTCKVWNLSDLTSLQTRPVHPLRIFSGHTLQVTSCHFLDTSFQIVSGSGDKLLKVFDGVSGKECASFSTGDSVSCVAARGNFIAAGTEAGYLYVLETSSLDELKYTTPLIVNCNARDEKCKVVFVSVAASQSYLISALENGIIRSFSASNGAPLGDIMTERAKIKSVCFASPKLFATRKGASISKNPLDLSLQSYYVSQDLTERIPTSASTTSPDEDPSCNLLEEQLGLLQNINLRLAKTLFADFRNECIINEKFNNKKNERLSIANSP